jgi:hypothetical protein
MTPDRVMPVIQNSCSATVSASCRPKEELDTIEPEARKLAIRVLERSAIFGFEDETINDSSQSQSTEQ